MGKGNTLRYYWGGGEKPTSLITKSNIPVGWVMPYDFETLIENISSVENLETLPNDIEVKNRGGNFFSTKHVLRVPISYFEECPILDQKDGTFYYGNFDYTLSKRPVHPWTFEVNVGNKKPSTSLTVSNIDGKYEKRFPERSIQQISFHGIPINVLQSKGKRIVVRPKLSGRWIKSANVSFLSKNRQGRMKWTKPMPIRNNNQHAKFYDTDGILAYGIRVEILEWDKPNIVLDSDSDSVGVLNIFDVGQDTPTIVDGVDRSVSFVDVEVEIERGRKKSIWSNGVQNDKRKTSKGTRELRDRLRER